MKILTEKYEALKPKLEKVIQVAAFMGVLLLILSPLIQWGERIYLLKTGRGVLFTEFVYNEMGDSIEVYQEMMRTLQSVVSLLAKIIAGAALIYGLLSLPKLREEWKNYLKAAVPLIVFAAYAAGIYLVTNIRGFTEFDAMPNYYMGDTIYEFMRHPFTYFFCGMLVLKGKWRKVLIIIFELSAMIMNVASMIDKWVVSNSCFTGLKGSAIFNNTNHYGYYLAIVVICAALLFIYEDRAVFKTFHAANMALGMAAMISTGSLGPYVAVIFTLISFAVYCFKCERKRLKWVIIALGIIIAINLMMSMLVESLVSSMIRTVFDLGNIISDPSGSDDAGSGRWELWKQAVSDISRRPLLGWGIERYEVGGTAHCEPLQYAVNFGIPVTVLHAAAIAVVMVETFIKKKKLSKMTLLCFCCTFSYIISAMFGVAIFYTTPFFYIFLGLTYAEVGKSFFLKEEKFDNSTLSEENGTILKKV